LLDAGFVCQGEMWTHTEMRGSSVPKATYIVLGTSEGCPVEVTADDVDEDVIAEWVARALNNENIDAFGQELLAFVRDPPVEPQGAAFEDDHDDDDGFRGLRDLPTVDDLAAQIGVLEDDAVANSNHIHLG